MRAEPATKDYFIGAKIGGYRINAKLGEGAMGVVYRGVHSVLGRPAAIKFLNSQFAKDEELVARFFTEAQVVNGIRHPNIVDITDFGQRGSLPYFVMELLEGQTLLSRLEEEGRCDVQTTLRIGSQVASALAAAHDKGIVHRDLKPDNIFLCNHPDYPDYVKVFDFGIAKLIAGGEESDMQTQVGGALLGTPHYMSPEQCVGEESLDHTSDVYSLGVVLYRMVTGVVPFNSSSISEIIGKHLSEEPVAPCELNAELPQEFESVILRAMEKDRSKRFSTMREFRSALQGCDGKEVEIKELPEDPTAGRRARGRVSTSPPPVIVSDTSEKLVENVLSIILERIESDRLVLPSMPSSALLAVKEMDNPNVTFRKIAEIIENDPVLTPQLYKRASTARFGNAGPPRSIEQAISRLGMSCLKTTLVELSAHKVYDSKNRKIRKAFKGIWDHTVAVGLASRAVAENLGGDPFSAHLAGLMHDVGKPIVAGLLLEAEKKLGMKKKDWLSEENWMSVVQRTHKQVGSALAENWELPPVVAQVIKGSAEYSSEESSLCANIVHFSNAFAKMCGRACGPFDEEEIEDLVAEGVECLGLDWVFVHNRLRAIVVVSDGDESSAGGSTQVLK